MSHSHDDMVWFSLVGDALSLGSHWIYDPQEIQDLMGRVDRYESPRSDYHPGKTAGDFTHYGDQTLLLFKVIAEAGEFDLAQFRQRWRAFWENPDQLSYRDGATRQTLEKLRMDGESQQKSSDSTDIGGAARIAPLFLLPWKDDEALVNAAQLETAMTHPEQVVVEAAELFCRTALAVSSGCAIDRALWTTYQAGTWQALTESWIQDAERSAGADVTDLAALKSYGLSCSTSDAFPGICHLLLRYPNDPQTALIENASAGGDNAARGMLLGLIYGAGFPLSALPDAWITGLNARTPIQRWLGQLRN